MISKVFKDVKEIYFKVSPYEVKIQQVAEKIVIISDQQKEIINKFSQKGEQVDLLKKMAFEMQEKLRHTMFMIQQIRFVQMQTKQNILEYF